MHSVTVGDCCLWSCCGQDSFGPSLATAWPQPSPTLLCGSLQMGPKGKASRNLYNALQVHRTCWRGLNAESENNGNSLSPLCGREKVDWCLVEPGFFPPKNIVQCPMSPWRSRNTYFNFVNHMCGEWNLWPLVTWGSQDSNLDLGQ